MRADISGHMTDVMVQVAANPKTTYTLSGILGFTSVLTFNELVGAIGVFASIILAAFTAWSNHKRNKAQIRAADAEIARANANSIKPYPENEASHGR